LSGIDDWKDAVHVPGAMDFMGELVALSMKHDMGIDVSAEVRDILRRCDTQEDRQMVIRQCQALGIPVSESST
jgi:hypothetical protein